MKRILDSLNIDKGNVLMFMYNKFLIGTEAGSRRFIIAYCCLHTWGNLACEMAKHSTPSIILSHTTNFLSLKTFRDFFRSIEIHDVALTSQDCDNDVDEIQHLISAELWNLRFRLSRFEYKVENEDKFINLFRFLGSNLQIISRNKFSSR